MCIYCIFFSKSKYFFTCKCEYVNVNITLAFRMLSSGVLVQANTSDWFILNSLNMKFIQSHWGFPWSLLFPIHQILSKTIKKEIVNFPSQIKAETDFWQESVSLHCYQRQHVRRTEKNIATLTCVSTALEKKTFKRAACFYYNPGLDSVKCHDLTSARRWSAAGKSILVGRHREPLAPSAIRCLAGAGSVTS